MKILVVGGTSFVGRAIAWSAWHHGHQVTVINRGVTPSDLPEAVEHLVGDRQGDLSALEGRSFDATVDAIAYRPSDVDRLADVLTSKGGQYIQISSISAYEEPSAPGATEATTTLWPEGGVDPDAPITGGTYGPLKAESERAGWRRFGEDSTMVRPTYVIGAHDATLRFPYWVERVRRGGEVAVPGPSRGHCSTSMRATWRTSSSESPRIVWRAPSTSRVPRAGPGTTTSSPSWRRTSHRKGPPSTRSAPRRFEPRASRGSSRCGADTRPRT